MGQELYYDGRGVPRTRDLPDQIAWSFGVDGWTPLSSALSINADLRAVKNYVKVTGAPPKGRGEPVSAEATADRGHPLSPWDLAQDDETEMWLEDHYENQHIRTESEAQKVADQRLIEGLRLTQDASFTAPVVPHLDIYDLLEVSTPYEYQEVRLRQFNIPWKGLDMQVGYRDPYAMPDARILRTRHHVHKHRHHLKSHGVA
jgi:hypothetical protein